MRVRCFHYKNFHFKTYPKDIMSLSDAERSESYAIEKSYSKYSFRMVTRPYSIYFVKRYTIIVAFYHKWKRSLKNMSSQYETTRIVM